MKMRWAREEATRKAGGRGNKGVYDGTRQVTEWRGHERMVFCLTVGSCQAKTQALTGCAEASRRSLASNPRQQARGASRQGAMHSLTRDCTPEATDWQHVQSTSRLPTRCSAPTARLPRGYRQHFTVQLLGSIWSTSPHRIVRLRRSGTVLLHFPGMHTDTLGARCRLPQYPICSLCAARQEAPAIDCNGEEATPRRRAPARPATTPSSRAPTPMPPCPA